MPAQLTTDDAIREWKVFWHGVLMLGAFLVFMLPAAGLARYMKAAAPNWFAVHWRMQAASFAMSIIATVLVFDHLKWQIKIWNVHTILGVTIMAVMLPLQILLGYLSNKLWHEGKAPGWWPDKLHWALGYLLMAAAVINVAFGLQWYYQILPGFLKFKHVTGTDLLTRSENSRDIAWYVYGALVAVLVIGVAMFESLAGQVHEHQLQSPHQDDDERQSSSTPDLAYESTLNVNQEQDKLLPNVQDLGGVYTWSERTTLLAYIGWSFLVVSGAFALAVLLIKL